MQTIDINGTAILPPGVFVPKCREDGAFVSVQCNPSTGHCWCVDEDGVEIVLTRTKEGRPQCERSRFRSPVIPFMIGSSSQTLIVAGP